MGILKPGKARSPWDSWYSHALNCDVNWHILC